MILAQDRNCWRVARADRASFLIDAAAYFSALRDALERAEREVIIVGWDVDSRLRLVPGRGSKELLPFLNGLLRRRPELRVFVLSWDFSFIYTLEREALPTLRFARDGHPRLQFQVDGLHPLLASHHQKIVAIDRRVAFVGGLDLTIRRWDRPEHRAHEPDRVDPEGKPYPPAHDVQLMVDGEAAAAVADLAANRWLMATGTPPASRLLGTIDAPGRDPWPTSVSPDLRDATIGISRTMPALDDRPAAEEVLALTLDVIASARRFIYIETQYLTSAAVGQALAASLEAPAGPEIVVVMPREQSGWLEQSSMGVMRARLLRRLRDADRHGRLRMFYPVVPGLNGACVNVHSKVLVADDVIARVGSANLSNRSMGLDTECDLTVDATAEGASPDVGRAVATFRNRLLAEHLGADVPRVAATLEETGSLIATIERLRGGARTLEAVTIPPETDDAEAGFNLAMLDGFVCDPERPAPDLIAQNLVPPEARRPAWRSMVAWAFAFALAATLVAVWRLTPLRGLLDLSRLTGLGRALASQPAAPVLVVGAYLLGALVFFPITLLLTATALVFEPLPALAYGLGGALCAAALAYGAGRLVARHRPRWLERPSVERIRRALARRGILAVVALRFLPVGNFTLFNVVAGAMGVRLRDFLAGTAIGLLPGTLALTLFAHRLGSMVRNPGPRSVAMLAVIVAIAFGVLFAVRRMVRDVRTPQERHG